MFTLFCEYYAVLKNDDSVDKEKMGERRGGRQNSNTL